MQPLPQGSWAPKTTEKLFFDKNKFVAETHQATGAQKNSLFRNQLKKIATFQNHQNSRIPIICIILNFALMSQFHEFIRNF